ncbi:hypothetical protein QR680_017585 [Steinernema hermaphroditum]|uniref:Poly [ADP-ribose] polymerase n=1 Tax=Steinernema hermaphroditum TaxID=289476 RepID=A0AA39LPN0_9BILA|nr:hypothetical protein QR680_017585 [Steinernema hermaphroditum]
MTSTSVEWEFELKKDKWIRFEDDLSSTLNEHWQDEVFKTEHKGAHLEFNFNTMKQKNCDSGYQRNIRCVFLNSDGERCAWEYTNKRRRFVAFLPNLLPTLEDAYEDKTGDLIVDVGELSAEVDFEKMTLTNSEKDFVRNLRRTISEADSAETQSPVPTRGASERIRKKRQALEEAGSSWRPVLSETKLKANKKKEQDSLLDEDVDEPVPSKPKTRKVADISYDDENKKKVVIKGSSPVDPECTQKVSNAHVYCEGRNIYDAMLNQTNIQNNNNKFFLIQLLEDDNTKRYSVWFRWGRVGFRGQTNLQPCGNDLEKAKDIFCNKFFDKTRNDWGSRDDFEKVPGKYDLIKMDYATANNDKENEEKSKKDVVESDPSQLDKRIQAVLQLICDIRTMEEAVLEMEYDASRAPLGKVTKEQIKSGYEALKRIEQFIGSSKFNRDFVDAVNDYYTRIPHAFGMRQPPLIKTKEALKKELALLDVLSDIEVAVRKLNEGKDELTSKINPIDRHYESMKCDLTPLESSNSEYKIVDQYLQNTHAPTHSSYKMKLRNVFAVNKHGGKENLKTEIGNRKLLWHGSRLANWYGILSQGLRIAPPEAPVTGYMFGKGVYFADMSSKSANYCFPQPGKPGFLLLAEVLLGETNNLVDSDYNASKLPTGKSSTFGMGRIGPDPAEETTLPNGCVIPIGKPVEMQGAHNFSLNYNEYIVYDTNQINLKYLVEVDFDFESLL